mgnify:CR=1 FL=1|jgi:hypothetical protein|tara:strand:- start:247 stop:510 length:264 start_codon:yes stop_codon:yes gene_type:complete
MWWHNLLGSIPFLLIIFFLLRHMTLERTAWVKERALLLNIVIQKPTSGPVSNESFIPFDDPRMKSIIDHANAQRSTVGSVEGEDSQP